MPNFREIAGEMKKLRDPTIYALYKVRTFTTKVSPGVKQIMYQGTVQGEEMEYPNYIQFRGVEFSDEEKEDFIPYETKDRAGDPIVRYYKMPELDKNDVALKCTCTDFRFMWEFPLYKAKSLVGTFRRYVPPHGVRVRPPKNPEEILGFCKHIWSFVKALQNSDLVK